MQKARRHPETAPTACKRTVSGSISLPYFGYFSPFPHGTSSLSVSQEYLALPDGSGRFTQDFTCPALLRILLGINFISHTGLSPSMVQLSRRFYFINLSVSVLQPHKLPKQIWFGLFPVRSPLLTGITIVFSSSGYLDVSVHRVSPLAGNMSSTCWVAPFGNLRI